VQLELPGGGKGAELLLRADREGWRLLLATGERDLDRAIRWATGELGERYVLHGR
jgi:hypothetical protein